VSRVFSRHRIPEHIDLQSLRDTLLYVSSDIKSIEGLEALAAHVRAALDELDKIDSGTGTRHPAPLYAKFMPVDFD